MKPAGLEFLDQLVQERAVSARLVFGLPTACGISMNRPGDEPVPGWAATNSVIGSLIPAAASRSPSMNTVVPLGPADHGCLPQRAGQEQVVRGAPFHPDPHPCAVDVGDRGEVRPTDTAYTPSISVYGAVKAISPARAARRRGSRRRPARRDRLDESSAAAKQRNSTRGRAWRRSPGDIDGVVPEIETYRLYYRFLETADEYFEYPTHASGQGRWNIYGVDLPEDVLRKVYRDNALRLLPHLR